MCLKTLALLIAARHQSGTRLGAPYSPRHTRVPTVPSWLPPFFAALHTGRSLEAPATALKLRASSMRTFAAWWPRLQQIDALLAWDLRVCMPRARRAQGARSRRFSGSVFLLCSSLGRPAHESLCRRDAVPMQTRRAHGFTAAACSGLMGTERGATRGKPGPSGCPLVRRGVGRRTHSPSAVMYA